MIAAAVAGAIGGGPGYQWLMPDHGSVQRAELIRDVAAVNSKVEERKMQFDRRFEAVDSQIAEIQRQEAECRRNVLDYLYQQQRKRAPPPDDSSMTVVPERERAEIGQW